MPELWQILRDVLAVIGALGVLALLLVVALGLWLWWTGRYIAREFADEEQELQERAS